MSINPITNYPEATELTENDYLPVATPTGLKKVKGSNVGGGGGADTFVMTLSAGESGLVCDKTITEGLAAFNAGKIVTVIVNMSGEYQIGNLVGATAEGMTFFVVSDSAFIKVEADITSGGTDNWHFKVSPVSWQDA